MTFTIEHVTHDKTRNIFVELYFEATKEYLEVEIYTVRFYTWLDAKDRLEWVHDDYDEGGNHTQKTGRYKDGRQFMRLASEETIKMNLTDYINDNEIILQHFEN